MHYGKTITIFLADGTPDGIITASLTNWNGECIKSPREDITNADFKEMNGPGVYFLICTDTEDGQDAVYIGEAENLRERLNRHIQDYKAGKEEYYWQTAVMFTGTDLNKTLIRFLEANLTTRARQAKRYKVLTQKIYAETIIKMHERAAMEEFMDNIQTLLAALNYRILEPILPEKKKVEAPQSIEDNLLHMKYGTGEGTGYLTPDSKFVLLKESRIAEVETSSCRDGIRAMRKSAIEKGKIVDQMTTEDMIFSSTSNAASFVGGASLSGPACWKNKEGISLRELQKDE